MTRYYKLDAFFEKLTNGSLIKDISIINNYPNLKEELNYYKIKLAEAEKEPISIDIGQEYIHETGFENIGIPNNFYEIRWSIPRIKQITQKYDIPVSSFPIHQLLESIDPRHIKKEHLEYALKNTEPVIVVYFQPLQTYLVIDGNHRVVSRFASGEDYIPAYILNSKQHIEAMTGNIYTTLYKIHWNISIIFGYIAGNITEEELAESCWTI